VTEDFDFFQDQADPGTIEVHLRACDADFDPPLSQRVDLSVYAARLVERAVRFEAWSDGRLVGMVAAYANAEPGGSAFITNVSVLPSHRGRGLARRLVTTGLAHLQALGFRRVELEVGRGGAAAIALYRKLGFQENGVGKTGIMMARNEQDIPRDYDAETVDTGDRLYAYGFDFDVMHPFMIGPSGPSSAPGPSWNWGVSRGISPAGWSRTSTTSPVWRPLERPSQRQRRSLGIGRISSTASSSPSPSRVGTTTSS
jgi:ribosomal protein S18 acetylase RimI-like enzyme